MECAVTVPEFKRAFFEAGEPFMRIGDGDCGGKASGLIRIRNELAARIDSTEFPDITLDIPVTTVVTTEVFDAFMERNGLYDIAGSGAPDERIAHAFQSASLPTEFLGDLRAIVEQVHQPLAVRSSSLLEDALDHPFAGVYATKMIPNNEAEPGARFRQLVEAIKFVYASTFFETASDYLRSIDRSVRDEKMAVIIQEVIGQSFGDRFYPHISGVCRSYSYYRSGNAKPEEGVVNLALGLGKTIVDGGVSWAYSPSHPKAPPPFATTNELMKNTQLDFWAVNMGRPPAYDPAKETEYLVKNDLGAADYDNTLRFMASTYSTSRDCLVPGTGITGPRVLNFVPLLDLEEKPLNRLIRRLLDVCEEYLGSDVEIEFAATFPSDNSGSMRVGFLQVRPMMAPDETVEVDRDTGEADDVLLYSETVMGNGVVNGVRDVVFVKPDTFLASQTPKIAVDVERFNKQLVAKDRPYLLIGFGRWGSSDPWLGIPVKWSQISGAKVIVESTLPDMNVQASQGAHFFHNISSFRISYFTSRYDAKHVIDWPWLENQRVADETEFVRHVELDQPVVVRVDGRTSRGAIWRSR